MMQKITYWIFQPLQQTHASFHNIFTFSKNLNLGESQALCNQKIIKLQIPYEIFSLNTCSFNMKNTADATAGVNEPI